MEQASSIGRVEFNVFSKVGDQIPPNDGKRVVAKLAQAVGPLLLVKVLHVPHRGACSSQNTFIVGLKHVVEKRKCVPCQTPEQTRQDVGHGPLDEGFLSFVQPKSELMAEISVGFDGFRQAQGDLVGHLSHGV